jgi:hypothetical protein
MIEHKQGAAVTLLEALGCAGDSGITAAGGYGAG